MEKILPRLIKALPANILPERPEGDLVVIDTSDPAGFWNRFLGAVHHGKSIAILDPQWPDRWKQHYRKIAEIYLKGVHNEILIPTSGTIGKPRFCRHTLETLSFAATSFACLFASDGYKHAINVLPSHHIGGLMPVFRSACCDGKVVFAHYRQLELSCTEIVSRQTSISLVPTQLIRMLDCPRSTEFLKNLGIILIGGAACPEPVLHKARECGLHLAPCYGSTETAAMVTALPPDAFLEGETGVGKALPGMAVGIGDDNCIFINSGSIQNGYLPDLETFPRNPYITSDIGHIDARGNLHVIGRTDRIINSGGKKIIPEQVETSAWKSGMVTDARCHGVNDPDWGEKVTLDVVFNDHKNSSKETLAAFLREDLPPYAVPKVIHAISAIDRNAMGKSRA